MLEEARAWQARLLSALYLIVYFNALFVKSRQDGSVKNKAGLGLVAALYLYFSFWVV